MYDCVLSLLIGEKSENLLNGLRNDFADKYLKYDWAYSLKSPDGCFDDCMNLETVNAPAKFKNYFVKLNSNIGLYLNPALKNDFAVEGK